MQYCENLLSNHVDPMKNLPSSKLRCNWKRNVCFCIILLLYFYTFLLFYFFLCFFFFSQSKPPVLHPMHFIRDPSVVDFFKVLSHNFIHIRVYKLVYKEGHVSLQFSLYIHHITTWTKIFWSSVRILKILWFDDFFALFSEKKVPENPGPNNPSILIYILS